MTTGEDKKRAIAVATNFLSQHFSVQGIDAVLEGQTWIVTAKIELFGKIMMQTIRMDSKTCRIKDYLLTSMA